MAEQQPKPRFPRWAWWLAVAAALCVGMALGWFFREMYLRHGTIRLPKLGLSSLVLIGTVAVMAPLVWLMRSGERRDLLQKCLLVSVLVHVLMAMSFSAVQVSRGIIQYVREEIGMEIPLNLQAARMAELQLQLRHQVTELPASEQTVVQRPAELAMQVPADFTPPAPMQFSAPVARPGAMSIHAPGPRIAVPSAIVPIVPTVPVVTMQLPPVQLPVARPVEEASQEPTEAPRPEAALPARPAPDLSAPPINAAPVPVRPMESPSLTIPLPARPDAASEAEMARPSLQVTLGPLDLPAPVRIAPLQPLAEAQDNPGPPLGIERQATGSIAGPATIAPGGTPPVAAGSQTLAQAPSLAGHVPGDLPTALPAVPMPAIDLPRPALPLPEGLAASSDDPPPPPRPDNLLRARPLEHRPREVLAPREIQLDDPAITRRAQTTITQKAQPARPGAFSAGDLASAGLAPLRSPTLALLPTEQTLTQRNPEQRQPLVETFGGTQQTEQAVARALAYLARNQQPDGRWTRYTEDSSPHEKREQRHDVGLTGLATLSLLAGGHTPVKDGPWRDVVAKALDYLLDSQQRNGDVRGADGDLYSQAIATMALAEAAIMTGDERYRHAAHRAADFIIASRNHASGNWRYVPFEFGDMSVTGWQLMALHSAKQAGYDLPPHAAGDAMKWVRSLNAGRHGGLSSYRADEPPTASMTAQSVFGRLLFGPRPTDAQLREASDFVTRTLPPAGQLDFYQYYCTSLMLMQLQNDAWEKWNPAVRDHLLKLQRRGGDADGSFDPNDRWSDRGGRIYSTAIATLTLQVYYRYLPMYERNPHP